jgi:hypothetical protein
MQVHVTVILATASPKLKNTLLVYHLNGILIYLCVCNITATVACDKIFYLWRFNSEHKTIAVIVESGKREKKEREAVAKVQN